MLQFLYIISQIFYIKEACGYAKERIEKMDKCLKYQNNGYFDARLEKKRRKDSTYFLTFVSKFKREKIPSCIVEVGLTTINIHLILYTCTS
jgi:hypothetical protein